MDWDGNRLAEGPLVPHVVVGHVPPKMQLQPVSLLHLNRVLQWEEYWEPGEHPRGVGGGQDGDVDVLIQLTLEVPSKAVEDRVCHQVEAEHGVPVIIDHSREVGMVELEERLWWSELKPVLRKQK